MRHKANRGETKPWRRRLWCVFLLVILTLVLTAASVPPEQVFDLYFSPLVAGQRFDWVGWETGVVLEEVDWWLRGRPLPDDQASQPGDSLRGKAEECLPSPAGSKDEVVTFLERQRQIAELEDRIRAEVAQLPRHGLASPSPRSPILPPSITAIQDELDELHRRQEAVAPRVERILAAQVGQVLVTEGFGRGDQIWPPITFRFNTLPTYLVISPRDEIRTYRGVYLLPGIPEAERGSLEATIETQLDVSALVVNVGGVGSWPTMVTDSVSLHSLLDIVAHEWTHTYLFLRPLGWHYGDSRDLTTMNETVASIVGGEVADLVMACYYPKLAPPPAAITSPPEVSGSPREDFNQAMRRIRLRVDELLAEGRVSEAEAYMETERQKLVAAGYHLRRLNQAYFAFHGSYATSPASVDPIGPWLRQLRAQSGSLKAFVDQAAQMRSLDDLLRALGERGS